jgi:hypothetical protein
MNEESEFGSPISYLVLEEGTAVHATDGTVIGTVKHVLFIPDEDIFDGLVVDTQDGLRFVDASEVDRIYERAVVTTLTSDQAAALPAPEPGPAVYEADPAAGSGGSVRDRYLRLFRKGGWVEERSGEEQQERD